MGELCKVLFFKSENFLILICNRIGKSLLFYLSQGGCAD